MATNIELFNYNLPESFIAQKSVEPRDHSKLMVLDRVSGNIDHRVFYELVELLKAGDVLVFNTSKVFKARLVDGGVEMFILKLKDGQIECLLKPGKKFPVGSVFTVFGQDFKVVTKSDDGVVTLETIMSSAEAMAFCDQHGQVPTPPYVKEASQIEKDYQTVYAKEVGSVAAPTAGFHFTAELLDRLQAKGVQIEHVVLHVGIGTFRPVQVDTLEEHTMHSEWVSVPTDVAERINAARSEGRRVIAVGTTTTRALEGVASHFARIASRLETRGSRKGVGLLQAFEGNVNMFITPGYEFKVINGLITNFHLPKSTLLVLVSAFAGREHALAAYESAKQCDYRFFSFGDAMFIC
ncbi:MAG TPA: tRNA preQ1(34) S-adenosylmethionine ribosyltransferase-isomerase QueA [bacterium]|nr:tRNA preQ1(34) S-adenosylmethionine ribosyltransferase-isomerase QueA [bacterium]